MHTSSEPVQVRGPSAAVVVLVIALALVGCGNDPSDSAPTSSAENEASTTDGDDEATSTTSTTTPPTSTTQTTAPPPVPQTTAPPPTTLPPPPCEAGALQAKLDGDESILEIYYCESGWAVALIDVTSGDFATIALFEATGASWSRLDRDGACFGSTVTLPADVFQAACTAG